MLPRQLVPLKPPRPLSANRQALAQYRKWLMTICRNLLCAALRGYAVGGPREEPLDEQAVDSGRHAYGRQPSPEEMLAALQERAELHGALGQLPADERQAVQSRYFEKLSLAQVAGRLGLSVDSVKRALKHAFQALKRRPATTEDP
ncbi:MAG TPA: sigma-70 family RNA polymerase sigma factor [Pirellulales bacterium]|nr:sigma-70 family RNA polymerase sigma factor [Pirellulales bacterium]